MSDSVPKEKMIDERPPPIEDQAWVRFDKADYDLITELINADLNRWRATSGSNDAARERAARCREILDTFAHVRAGKEKRGKR